MKNRFLILLAAVAVAAIAACEKEDTSEWGKSEALVRKYGDFDGSAIPAFVTRGVLIAEKEIGLENRRVYYGPSTDSYDDDLCGIKSPSQYVFFESGIEWSCRSFPDFMDCAVHTWEYDTAARAFRLRHESGYEWKLVVEAFMPDEEMLILDDGVYRSFMRLHSDQATVDRYMETYGPLAEAQE